MIKLARECAKSFKRQKTPKQQGDHLTKMKEENTQKETQPTVDSSVIQDSS